MLITNIRFTKAQTHAYAHTHTLAQSQPWKLAAKSTQATHQYNYYILCIYVLCGEVNVETLKFYEILKFPSSNLIIQMAKCLSL